MANVLVTGGAGFIGSHVADELINFGHNVVVLDDLSGGFEDNVNKKAKFVKGSVVDYKLIDQLFDENKFDYVFHLAAYAAEGLSSFIKRFNYTNNLIGSMNLLNASVNVGTVKCFVFTSSIAVYGHNKLPMAENLEPKPEDSYGIAKYVVELELRASHELFGLNYIIFRPHNVYGERQNIGDKYRNVIGIFITQILQNKPLTIFGDGNQTRAFSYISDIAPIIARSVNVKEAYGQIFNVGADKPYSVNTLAKEVCDAMGAKPAIKHLESRNEVVHAFADQSKIRKFFPDLPQPVSLHEGVKKMASWAKACGCRKTKLFTDIEVTKNLPPSWKSEIKD